MRTDDSNGDVCCRVPEEEFREDSKDTAGVTMFYTISLLSFCKLVENVEIDTVAKVLYKHNARMVGHIVVVGRNGFQLCSCLQLMSTGLPCRHAFAALITELKRFAEFKDASVHPRWRISSEKWSLASAGCKNSTGKDVERGEGVGSIVVISPTILRGRN